MIAGRKGDSSCGRRFDLFSRQSGSLRNAKSGTAGPRISLLFLAVSNDCFAREEVERTERLSFEIPVNGVFEIPM